MSCSEFLYGKLQPFIFIDSNYACWPELHCPETLLSDCYALTSAVDDDYVGSFVAKMLSLITPATPAANINH